jgi:hypothetical protein
LTGTSFAKLLLERRFNRSRVRVRTPDVEISHPHRIIQPLLEAGLDLDEVRTLLFRVGFECLVTEGTCDLSDPTAFLGPQPAVVRAAWLETVDRMLSARDWPPEHPLRRL